MSLLCYSGTRGERFGGFDGSGVHLTDDAVTTRCGLDVLDVPSVPRSIEPLSCVKCVAPGVSGAPRGSAT